MSGCGCAVEPEDERQRLILILALSLNAIMFGVGVVGGIVAQSIGLIADSLDMLTDALAYGIALYAIGRGVLFKAKAAWLTGIFVFLLGLGVFGDAARRALMGATPESGLMLLIATASLAVNSLVLYLLTAYRRDEVHLRATWICTRADVIANVAVIASAVVLRISGWRFIDPIVGAAIGGYIVKEAWEILRNARAARLGAGTPPGLPRWT